ncbi:Pimeloyl-ACP methyl ester carboxylesterase [Fodinibius roseus]|uniref:Pimeloyl-ACP methyl ester carboxylesterase n=1 Tax=Fodinibius roseus TaxID=1194090 RepID=A0A1M4SM09_9BACT|nr:alpha/beta hydrolase [Fodinibius roseus]SHE33273.1 Pimeloyl-ACP methyl ester carboxylesterase [Fodinibius roseus]
MNALSAVDQDNRHHKITDNRSRLLASNPVAERRIDLAGISTAVLVGGEGPPIVLLHGPGETSLWWIRIIPQLIKTNRVIVPDLPGHGSSRVNSNTLEADLVFQWLSELIEQTTSSSPVLVGHLLGGSIAARFTIKDEEQVSRLILVNSFGLGKFRPAPGFALRLIHFMLRPTRKNYDRFLPQCMYDVDHLRRQMGEKWDPFLEYNLECARDAEQKAALRILMQEVGIPKISSRDLARITIPAALIWGRHDRANKLHIAREASEQYGWPLHVIDEARDDPKLEQPDVFVGVLNNIINTT